ncbi:protein of unknown function [Halolactibacillus halophilus]|uniref:DUF4153 domain-containing protein n=1 Tax=Halolactibacillus halophilus TaxID=306540 RepID=A0A1I5LZW6_9BACI|nr:DUF4153 domain-containing protein [Halolactibacillus halophilus]GEM00941.1 DUF4153 domain-containing protein [Halolactibacillus halophilus]SFP02306.1 protein of unknown function [Halolactibacillus halophilus]
MKVMERLEQQLNDTIQAVGRYPLAFSFILSLTIVNMIMIESNDGEMYRFSYTFVIGILFSLIFEHLYERFYIQIKVRLFLMWSALILTLGYFFLQSWPEFMSIQLGIRTSVIVLMSLLLMIWIPTIQSEFRFSQNVFVIFKNFFIALLYSIVLAIGISLIIALINALLFTTDGNVYLHFLNLIASLFFPSLFLSMMPVYIGARDQKLQKKDQVKKKNNLMSLTTTTPIFDRLLSYIIIPLTTIYSGIILIYLAINITGDLWSEVLLEPLLVSFTVVVLLVYILSLEVETKIAELFARVYPKVLLPIVLFQTIASIVKLTDTGVTYGRYFAILFGVFGTIVAIVYGFLSREKTGWIAPIFVVFGLISITPPVDAFSVSFYSQKAGLEAILEANNMLTEGEVVAKPDLAEKDKNEIIQYINHFEELDKLEKIDYLPENLMAPGVFETIFGFPAVYEYDRGPESFGFSVYTDLNDQQVINISGYDHILMNNVDAAMADKITMLEHNNQRYELRTTVDEETFLFTLVDASENILVTFDGTDMFTDLSANENYREISVDDATYTAETDQARLTLIIQNLDYYGDRYYANFFTLIDIKDHAND